MLVLVDGSLSPRIASDPRWSANQRSAAERLARVDGRATVVGLDAKMRPVIEAKLDGPGRRTRTALLRNGDPAKPVTPLAEHWS